MFVSACYIVRKRGTEKQGEILKTKLNHIAVSQQCEKCEKLHLCAVSVLRLLFS